MLGGGGWVMGDVIRGLSGEGEIWGRERRRWEGGRKEEREMREGVR